MKLPKVSIVICTLNCREDTRRCLTSIREQDYPQNLVEIIIVDSYSTDGTIEVARELGAKVILTKIRGYMEGKGMPKSLGCSKAKGDIIITIDSDNKLVEKDWIKKMVFPLMNDKSVNFVIARMAVVKSDSLVNQYLSLVGTDPFAIYASLDPQISLGNIPLKDNGNYYTYKITPENFYICGGYYLTFRKSTLKSIGGYTRDVDVIYTLAKKGMANLAIPKDAHLHHLITTGLADFIKKKYKWGKYYFSHSQDDRVFKWSGGLFGKFGRIRFFREVIKSLIFLPALLISIKMWMKSRKSAWLIHAPLVWLTTMVYIVSFIETYSRTSHKILDEKKSTSQS